MRWSTAVIVGLSLVALVDFAFVYVAVQGADPVVDSYEQGGR